MTEHADQVLRRFYARNPDLAAKEAEPVTPPANPMDAGTVSLEAVAESVQWPSINEMNFRSELLPLMRKNLVWDIVPTTKDIERWSDFLAVVPGSTEGNEIEEAAATLRRSRLIPLMPLVRLAAFTAGEIVSRAKMLNSGDAETDGGGLAVGSEHDVTLEVTSGTLAVIASLLDMEILTYGKAVTGV